MKVKIELQSYAGTWIVISYMPNKSPILKTFRGKYQVLQESTGRIEYVTRQEIIRSLD